MKGHGGKCTTSSIGWILVVIGAINWGLVGIGGFVGANWNVVNLVLGNWPALEWIVYILVGIAGVMLLFGCKCRKCKGGDCGNCGQCGTCRATMNDRKKQEQQ